MDLKRSERFEHQSNDSAEQQTEPSFDKGEIRLEGNQLDLQILPGNQFRFSRRSKNGTNKRFGLRFRKTGFFEPFGKLERIEGSRP